MSIIAVHIITSSGTTEIGAVLNETEEESERQNVAFTDWISRM